MPGEAILELVKLPARKKQKKVSHAGKGLLLAFTRHSTEMQKNSTQRQKDIIDPYCMEKFGKLPQYFSDQGVSGKHHNTPKWNEMLSVAKANPGSTVVLSDITRSCRTQEVFHIRCMELERAKARLVLVECDTQNRIVLGMLAALAEADWRSISTRMRDGRVRVAKAGKKMGGHVPYGYIKVDGDLVINEEQAKVVRNMFRMRAADCSFGEIANYLNSAAHPILRPSGEGLWDAPGVSRMLYSPIYCGIVMNKRTTFGWEQAEAMHFERADYQEQSSTHWSENKLDDNEYTIALRPDLQIVSNEVFLDVQEKRGHAKHRKPWNPDIYILGSLVKCPHCGGNLIVRKQSQRQSLVLICGNRKKYKAACGFNRTIDMITLERIVVGESLQLLQIDEETAYKAALHDALVEFSLGTSMSREELDRKIAKVGHDVVVLARKTSETELGEQAIAEELKEKETEYQKLHDQRSAMSTSLQFADDNLRTQTLAGALDMLYDQAPFRPKTEDELDIIDTLRGALLGVRLESREGDAELLDVHVDYDIGKLFGSNVSHVRTLVFSGRNLMHHGALKRRAQAELEQTYSAGRVVLSDAEWRTRPDIPEFSVTSSLPGGARKLVDALVLRIEADRPLKKCFEACEADELRYEKAFDRIRTSKDIDALIEWLEGLRPGKNWNKLRLSASKLPEFGHRFVNHPLKLLARLADPESKQAVISVEEWRDVVPLLRRNAGYSFDLALRNLNYVLSMIQNGGTIKGTLGAACRASKFSMWLSAFEDSGNLEAATRHLLAIEGRSVGPMRFEALPSGTAKIP